MKPTRHLLAFVVLIAVMLCSNSFAQEQTHEIYGTLTYPDGRPAANAPLIVYENCKNFNSTTDSNGGYCISTSAERIWIAAQINDYIAEEYVGIPSNAVDRIRKDIKLEYAALVLGEVTDASTCAPIEGADVCIGTKRTKTNSDGTFKVRILRRAGQQLTITKNGYVTKRMKFSSEASETTAWKIQLKPGGLVRGTVRDGSGKPISGISVTITEDGTWARSVKTDENGNYLIRDVDPDRPADMGLDDKRISAATNRKVSFEEGSKETTADFTVDIADKKLRTITGKVTNSNDSPVAGATVRCGQDICMWNAGEAKTDTNGFYTISGLTPSRDMIVVLADGFAPSFLPVDETGDAIINAKLKKAHSAGVRIVDPAGKPLPEVSITVCAKTPVRGRLGYDYQQGSDVYRWLYTTATDKDGRVSLPNLPAEGTLLELYKNEYIAPAFTAIRTDATDNVIQMKGMPEVAGTVVDADTGAPIQCFTVKWKIPGTYCPSGDSNSAFNHSDGRFLIRVGENWNSDNTKFEVKVLANGYVGETKAVKAIPAPVTGCSVIYRLNKAHSTKCRIIDSKGSGISGARITVIESDGCQFFGSERQYVQNAYKQEYTSGPDGSFSIDPVMEKSAILVVESSGYSTLIRTNADITKPFTLKLTAGAVLTVKAPAYANTDVSLDFIKNRCWSTLPSKKLSQDGIQTFSDLVAGDYIININNGHGKSEGWPITLTAGEKYTLDLTRKRPVTINGRFARKGAPVEGMNVIIRCGEDEKQFWVSSTTDADGRYTISIDKPGPATLAFYGEGVDYQYRSTNLKQGTNSLNVQIPTGLISGCLTDAKTGTPLGSERIMAMSKCGAPKQWNYDWSITNCRWESVSSATTNPDGTFVIENLPDGPIILSVVNQSLHTRAISKPILVKQNMPVRGIELKMPETGTIDLTVLDAKTGKPILGRLTTLCTSDGIVLYLDGGNMISPVNVPAGRYTLWVEPLDDQHMNVKTDVEIKPGKTAKVTLKLNAAKQKIIFRAAKGGKFEKLRWPDKEKASAQIITLPNPSIQEDLFKGRLWIGYKITNTAGGEPLIGRTEGFNRKRESTIPVKPGIYIIDAVLRNTEDCDVASKANLWKISTKITVKPERDTIIDIR